MASQDNTRYKTRHQDKAPRQDTTTHQHQGKGKTPPRTTDKTRKTVTVNYILPVLFFSSYILIQIIVLSGYYNISTDGKTQEGQKAWAVVAKKSNLYCSLYYVFFTYF